MSDHDRDTLPLSPAPRAGLPLAAGEDTASPSPEVLEELLLALAHSTGNTPDQAAVRAALRDAARHLPGAFEATWGPWLQHAGQALGLTLTLLRRPLEEVLREGHRQGPLATVFPSGEAPRWVLLDAWEGGHVRARANFLSEDGARWTHREVATRLAARGATPLTWVLAEESEPLRALRGTDGRTPSPFARVRELARLEAADLRAVLVYAVGVGLFALTTPIAVQSLVNTVAFGSLLQPLVVLSILLLGGLVFAGALRALQYWVVELLQQRLFIRVVSDLSHRLPRVRARAMDQAHGPELANRFFDVVTVQKASATLLLEGLAVVLQTGIGLLMLAFYHPLLLAFDFFLLVCVAGILFGYGRSAATAGLKESKAKYAVAAWLQELVRHPVAFRQRGGTEHALERADALARDWLGSRRKHFQYLFRQVLGALGLQAVASALLLGLGGWLVIDRQLSLGQLVAAELIVTAVLAAFAKFGKHLEAYYDLLAASDKLGQLVDLPMERELGESQPPRPGPASLVVRDVAFHYREDAPVLRGVDFSLQAGEKVALTGETAGGKSTLGELLYGLRTPKRGRVLLDGADTRDLSFATLRRDVALVGAAPELFAGTIVENLRMGQPGLPLGELRRVLEEVGLGEALSRLPEGLHTPLTTGGQPLSSGQRMLLHLARALLLRPRLLIVDEALDSLDARTRERVLRVLLSSEAPWTLLLITHHPDVLGRCERVLVLSEGQSHPLPSEPSARASTLS
jgi:putative ABC transport system ATP-binding protein